MTARKTYKPRSDGMNPQKARVRFVSYDRRVGAAGHKFSLQFTDLIVTGFIKIFQLKLANKYDYMGVSKEIALLRLT